MTIDEIAVDGTQQGHGYGAVLMRFADTLARHANCTTIRLNGIAEKVPFYEGMGYTKLGRGSPLRLDDEVYWPMERPVMYHQTLLELGR
jgi:GNAT superfamily N-acetyltransferase